MAKESGRLQSPDAIKNRIAQSRDQVAREFRGLRYEMDIPRKIRRSFREHTVWWVGAALAAGALLVVLPARQRVVQVDAEGKKAKPQRKFLEAGFLFGLARIAITLLKPTITKFVVEKVQGHSFKR